MVYLNFSNAEELIFYNREVQNLLPDHMFSLFEQWRLSKRIPYLREMGKNAILDFLNGLTEEDISALENYFKQKIIVEKLNYNVALNYKIPLNDVCDHLCKLDGFNYFSIWRDNEYLYISFWR